MSVEGELFEGGDPIKTHERVARVIGFQTGLAQVINAETLLKQYCEVVE